MKGPFEDIENLSRKSEKKLKGDPLVLSGFPNARKRFWLKQGLEPATVGFPINRLTSVSKSGTYRVRSVVWRKKNKETSPCISQALLVKKRRLNTKPKSVKRENQLETRNARKWKK